jgi:DNA gyrase subunit B
MLIPNTSLLFDIMNKYVTGEITLGNYVAILQPFMIYVRDLTLRQYDLVVSIIEQKALEYKIYENEEIKNIFTALGVFRGTKEDDRALNIDKLRYHKVVIMCDADVDGSHITTLILTFFFRHMKELIERGHIYIAAPPLYLVKKGKDQVYCWNEEERDIQIKLLGGEKTDSVHVQRYKGLGEMNAIQLWETTLDPKTRTLRQVTIDSAAEADRVFSMLMGDEVPPRRDFIEKNAKYAKIDA